MNETIEHSNGGYQNTQLEISHNGKGTRNDLPFNLDGVNKMDCLPPSKTLIGNHSIIQTRQNERLPSTILKQFLNLELFLL